MGHVGRALVAAAIALAAGPVAAQSIPAFPGAEGAGAAAVGGRGGDVYFVTSLLDTNTAGTLRYGISTAPSTGRTILFRTGGTIYLQSTLDINKPKITLAGQSAPGGGITLAYRQTQVSGVSDVVIRNLRFRPGNSVTLAMAGSASPYEPDALHVEGVNRVMVDHVSASWSVDEVLSVTNSTNTTVQWSAVTEALRNAGHSKGAHGYGALISGDVISYHHNYFAHNDSRNPRPGLSVSGNYVTGTINFDFRNNVNYDWGGENGYNGDEAGVMNMNYVGNYSVAGPSTSSSKTGRAFLVGLTDTRLFLSGNKIDSNRDLVLNGTDTGWSMIATSTATNPSKPTAAVGNTTAVSTQTADEAYKSVLAHAGATSWSRDTIDARVFAEPATQGGRIIDSGTQVGGYPMLATGTAPTDTDADGMPDAWEASLGLNPLVKNNNADFDTDGYTDLEEYLNDLAAWPAPLPAVLATGSSARYAVWSNWSTKWQPSRLDTAQINSGTAVVDAIGQDAGTIQVGAAVVAGQTPTLSLASGGLRVTSGLVIGSSTGSSALVLVSGGKLTVGGTIATGSATSGVFTFTGGTVAAAAIDATKIRATTTGSAGTFRVAGGSATLAPGDIGKAGRMVITGGLAFDAGSLLLDLGGTAAAAAFSQASAAYDTVATSGTATLGGAISLALTGSYAPAWLVPHTILTAKTVQGRFATVSGLDVGATKRLAVTYTATSTIVTAAAPGDTNVDGTIDILDAAGILAGGQFDTGDSTTWEQGDFNGDGVLDVLDAADFQMLGLFDAGPYTGSGVGRMASFGGTDAGAVASVPEPRLGIAAAIAAAAIVAIQPRRRWRNRATSSGTTAQTPASIPAGSGTAVTAADDACGP